MTFKEMEKLLKADGWMLKGTVGSHFQYCRRPKWQPKIQVIAKQLYFGIL